MGGWLSNALASKYWWFCDRWEFLQTKAKIIISTYQVVTVVPATFAVSLPGSITGFLGALSFLSPSFSSIVPSSCFDSSYDYVDRLIVATVSPLLFSAVLFSLYHAESKVRAYLLTKQHIAQSRAGSIDQSKTQDTSATRRHSIITNLKMSIDQSHSTVFFRYWQLFLYLTYFILPDVTSTIFAMYVCTDVNPDSPNHDQLYLRADLSISCSSDRFHQGIIWASIMCIVYPFGVPLMYYMLLRLHRDIIREGDVWVAQSPETPELNGKSTKQKSEGRKPKRGEQLSNNRPSQAVTDMQKRGFYLESDDCQIESIKFLFESYRGKFWYWEVVETTRRLMLTAVLSVLDTGSSTQLVLGILITFGYIELYAKCSPYRNAKDGRAASVGQHQIIATFFGTLVISYSLVGPSNNALVGLLLVLVNLAVILENLSSEVDSYRETKDLPPLTLLSLLCPTRKKRTSSSSSRSSSSSSSSSRGRGSGMSMHTSTSDSLGYWCENRFEMAGVNVNMPAIADSPNPNPNPNPNPDPKRRNGTGRISSSGLSQRASVQGGVEMAEMAETILSMSRRSQNLPRSTQTCISVENSSSRNPQAGTETCAKDAANRDVTVTYTRNPMTCTTQARSTFDSSCSRKSAYGRFKNDSTSGGAGVVPTRQTHASHSSHTSHTSSPPDGHYAPAHAHHTPVRGSQDRSPAPARSSAPAARSGSLRGSFSPTERNWHSPGRFSAVSALHAQSVDAIHSSASPRSSFSLSVRDSDSDDDSP
jgi:hypothetical protein